MKAAVLRNLCAALLVTGGAAWAQENQESTSKVDTQRDWHVFAEPPNAPQECWGVAIPKETVNTDSEGRIKAVKRGDIMLFITFEKGSSNSGQVSFTGGYPFADNSFVELTIGDSKFEMFTDGEWAWLASDGDDAKVIAAMKRGANAVLKARSSRGTITRDTFSLFGFTAAADSAENFCKT